MPLMNKYLSQIIYKYDNFNLFKNKINNTVLKK